MHEKACSVKCTCAPNFLYFSPPPPTCLDVTPSRLGPFKSFPRALLGERPGNPLTEAVSLVPRHELALNGLCTILGLVLSLCWRAEEPRGHNES